MQRPTVPSPQINRGHDAAELIVSQSPRYVPSADAATRPSLVGRTLLELPAPPNTADFFEYALVRSDDGQLYMRRTGGIAGVREWFGPNDVGQGDVAPAMAALRTFARSPATQPGP